MTSNEQTAYKLALTTAVKACQVARALLENTEDYDDLYDRISGVEVELSNMEIEIPLVKKT